MLESTDRVVRLVEEAGSPRIGDNGWELACASSGAAELCALGLGSILVSGRPQPEPISWLKAPLTRRAEEKPRERSGRLACSIPSGQGELSGPGQEVTTAAGDADSRSLGGCPRREGWRGSPEEVGVGLAGGRRVGELCELKQYAGRNLGLEAGNSPPSCHISRTGRAAWPGGHLPPLLNQKCPLRRSSGAFYRYCQALT